MRYSEIARIASEKNMQKSVIDKDWILGHFLNAMFSLDEVQNNFVFKGGTCLKKCYFDDYRFSEDLDFTLTDPVFVVDQLFIQRITAIAETNSGAKFHLKEIISQLYDDIPQGYEVTILFWGADHHPNQMPLPASRWQTKIKLDISFSEKLLSKPVLRPIFHTYSDYETVKSKIPVYPLNEIAAEKLRALIQRNRPRDIYDLYYLSSSIEQNQHKEISELLKKKSEHKKVTYQGHEDFVNTEKQKKNKRAWENSLSSHLPKDGLIDFDIAYQKVDQFVKLILNQG